ncbi:MAG: glycerol-3-phosphate dehydrogenase [Candidatus Omnitrophica bacterium]|nr:glycerol-3-phosphate dehydrogenase [Candidatus Omnitrophota bacterium]
MIRDIERMAHGEYDLLVIGGGINGAAVANMAALNGLRVVLVEKGDFASGTSSKSTKLIHGGLRYLENLEFDLVRESLLERAIQLKSAPHFVRPLGFVIPVYKGDKRPLWMVRLGVFLYDLLCGRHKIAPHKLLTPEKVASIIPDISSENLIGGVMYYDAQMDDARLCLENILNAENNGAHIANYMEVKTFIVENGRTVGVEAVDRISQKRVSIRASHVVCCAGPWTNVFMAKERSRSPMAVRTTKGVHIIYKGLFSPEAMFLTVKKDRRLFFIIPWGGNSLIGTTDTDYQGSPDNVSVSDEDVEYLLKEVQRYFPKKKVRRENVITTFAGLRPLVSQPGRPSKVSRKHVIKESYSGVVYVMGGKYTTYRKIAEDVVTKVKGGKLIDTRDKWPLYGGGRVELLPEDIARKYEMPLDVVDHLIATYGTRYKDVLEMVKENSSLKSKICSCSSVIEAQVVYAIEKEMALTAEDIINRRLGLVYQDCPSKECERKIAEVVDKKGVAENLI